jgi:hypothetical protein
MLVFLFALCLAAVCYSLYQIMSYSSPPDLAEDTNDAELHKYASKYLVARKEGVEQEMGVAGDELFAFMFATGITRFRFKGKTFVLSKALVVD